MSTDIHFAAAVRLSDTVSVGRLCAARNALMRATRSCSALSRVAPSTSCGVAEPSKLTTASTVAKTADENRINTPLGAAHARCGHGPEESRRGVRKAADADLIRSACLPPPDALRGAD